MELDGLLASDSYVLVLFGVGVALLGVAVLPHFLTRSVVALPMVLVACGALLGWALSGSVRIDPLRYGGPIERMAEMAVIISLMSAGLKLDRPLGLKRWSSAWRLLAITMPLSIAALAFGGAFLLGLPLAAALLLGAVLAPTDPVLASSVQVGPPNEGKEDEPRFALTSEAGMNDGLAFPFVNLALLIAASGLHWEGLSQWLLLDVCWKIAAGIAIGAVVGHAVAWVVFRHFTGTVVTDGSVAFGLTLSAYGLTELAHGYGFIAVFVAALMFRRMERFHEYHQRLHDFSEQLEGMLMAVILLLFGMALSGGLLSALTWPAVLLGLLFVLLVRPLAGMAGLLGAKVPGREKRIIAVYGIRGIGTFYYLAHALNSAEFPVDESRLIWALCGFIVLVSIVLHGSTASRVLR